MFHLQIRAYNSHLMLTPLLTNHSNSNITNFCLVDVFFAVKTEVSEKFNAFPGRYSLVLKCFQCQVMTV